MKYSIIFFLWFSTTALSFDSGEEFEKAVIAKQSQDWATSLVHVKNTIAHQPDYLPARMMMAELQLRTSEAQNALSTIEVAEQLGGDINVLAVMRGSAFKQLNDIDRAINAIGIVKVPTLPPYWRLQLLRIRLAARDYLWAEAYFSSLTPLELEQEPSLYLEWASLYYHTGRFDLAMDLLQAQTFPPAIEYKSFLLKGELSLLAKKEPEAEAHYLRALASNPNELSVLLAVTRFYLQSSKPEQALKHSKTLINNFPNHPVAQLLHAGVLRQLGDDNSVSEVIRELNYMLSALNQETQNQQHLLMFKALLSYFSENWLLTKQTMETFVSLYSFDKVANLLLLKSCFQLNDYACARSRVKVGIDNNQFDKAFLLLAIQLYRSTNEIEKAIELAKQGLTELPSDQDIIFALALLYQTSGNNTLAISTLKDVPNQEQDKVLLTLGYLLFEEKQFLAATEVVNKLLGLFPDKVETFLFAAEVALASGKREFAEKLIQQALTLDPNHRPSLLVKAAIELADERYEAVAVTYQTVLEANPDDEYVLLLSAALQKLENKSTLAQATLTKILELNPRNDFARAELLALVISFGQSSEAFKLSQQFTEGHLAEPKILELKLQTELMNFEFELAKLTLGHLTDLAFNDKVLMLKVSGYYIQTKDYKRAGIYLSRAKQLDEEGDLAVRILRQEANLAFRSGQTERLYELIARLDYLGQKVPAMELMAFQQIKTQKWLEAKSTLEALLRIATERKYYFLMVDTLIRLEKEQEARRYLTRWLSIAKEDNEARLRLSILQRNSGDLVAARRTLTQARDLQQQPILLNNLANLYLPDSPKTAVDYALSAFELAPEVASILDTLGWALILDNRFEIGLEYIREATVRDATNPEHYYHLAYALIKLDKSQQAKGALENMARLDKHRLFVEEYKQLINELKN